MQAPQISLRHDLHDRVNQTLDQDAGTFGRQITFRVDDAEVILDGVVGSYYQKQMVQETLRRIDGICRITNRLRVIAE